MALSACLEHGIIARELDGAPGPDAAPTDAQVDAAPSDELRFTDLWCEPDVLNGEPLHLDEWLDCYFRVTGASGRMTTLSCEDGQGMPMDCDGGWPPRWIEPVGPSPLPIEEGYFTMVVGGPGRMPGSVVWVADDGVQQERLELSWQMMVNGPPDIWVDCAGNDTGFVSVTAGDLLDCVVHTWDPDLGDIVEWAVFLEQGPPPMSEPTPQWGEGPEPTFWAWQTDLQEAGEILTYRFLAHDSVSSAQPFDLVVTVQ